MIDETLNIQTVKTQRQKDREFIKANREILLKLYGEYSRALKNNSVKKVKAKYDKRMNEVFERHFYEIQGGLKRYE